MTNIVEFPQKTNIILGEKDYAFVIRNHGDETISAEISVPKSVMDEMGRNPKTVAPFEMLLMMFFEKVLYDEEVTAQVMEMISDIIYAGLPATRITE